MSLEQRLRDKTCLENYLVSVIDDTVKYSENYVQKAEKNGKIDEQYSEAKRVLRLYAECSSRGVASNEFTAEFISQMILERRGRMLQKICCALVTGMAGLGLAYLGAHIPDAIPGITVNISGWVIALVNLGLLYYIPKRDVREIGIVSTAIAQNREILGKALVRSYKGQK